MKLTCGLALALAANEAVMATWMFFKTGLGLAFSLDIGARRDVLA